MLGPIGASRYSKYGMHMKVDMKVDRQPTHLVKANLRMTDVGQPAWPASNRRSTGEGMSTGLECSMGLHHR